MQNTLYLQIQQEHFVKFVVQCPFMHKKELRLKEM